MSFIGPGLLDSALPAAPLPRPPQPTSATWMVLFSAAWTCGMTAPARAEAAAMRPVLFRNSRRDVTVGLVSFMEPIVCRPVVCCQRLMFVSWIIVPRARRGHLPPPLLAHLLDRIRKRNTSANLLVQRGSQPSDTRLNL